MDVGNKRLTPKEFKKFYSKVPRLCVEIAIRTDKGIILTLRKLPTWNNFWHLPGGTVFYNETILNAVDRIASDELGISVKVGNILGYIEYSSEQKERGFGWTISLVFSCKIKRGKLRVNEDASEVRTFSLGELPENMISEQREFLNRKLK
jgi:colanic acid biosynthesis protein WcaH